MFCPNCGNELNKLNQRFCTNCGYEIPTISEAPQLRSESSLYASTSISQKIPGYTAYPVSQQKPFKMEEPLGPYSKKCLGFALASIGIAIFCLVFFSGIRLILLIGNFKFRIGLIIVILIIVMSINFMGLMFGIFSKINSGRAGKSEPENTVEKIGSVFSIFGIIFNAISMIMVLILAPIIFI